MTDLTFPQSIDRTRKHRVIFLILERVELLDLAGPAQVFDTAVTMGVPYSLHFCAANPEIQSAQGLLLAKLEPLPPVKAGDLVMVAGVKSAYYCSDRPLLNLDVCRWLANAYAAGAEIASICSGAIALGEAGLLNGRRCTTHWSLVEVLQQSFPAAHVLDMVLYVSDRNITTSAGIASGIDMALSLVEQHHGSKLAAEVARWMVIYLRRDGSQHQQSAYLEYRGHLHSAVHRVQDWLAEHAVESASLAELAVVAKMSVRSFSRAFKEATGLTPVQYQQRLRLEVAATLLNNADLSIETVAARCGFEDTRHFRRLWQRHFGTTPSMVRKQQNQHSISKPALDTNSSLN
ncbi:GlxA family transcriptional regulator [Leptolyngbya sp. FACHB-261]|uniref:GlxA family transcriptional regulator n=1 Tax=Leptolyngbya sp. FACHB-261 TaxID=2692806 RepID=UPI0018F056AD|nr:GlxA family transcriptional regulator [Leptolyngbya sp. FACHB-261]